ncbi:MAG: YraN family protein [Cyclobacteriaceae bacterium]|nr:YraN family protein [Cyclobacteriaceae bacterium]UYN87070.1 MAG: YraN family protein [Cyclobacteriaceae bacterium]
MSDKAAIGKKGEDLAAEYLERKGYAVVARNFRFKHAEIDLIVKKNDWLLFVEVKTRSSSAFGEPESFVDGKKGRKIFEAAEEYIFANNWHGHIRFDIISVKLGNPPEIRHFEDAIN